MPMERGDRNFAEQMGQSRQRAEREDVLFVDNYGGLNTTSPSVNNPYSDSPSMVNMDIDISGVLQKRQGSYIRKAITGIPQGFFIAPYTLENDEVVLLVKNGTDLSFYYLPDQNTKAEMTLINTFSNVWSSAAENIRPSATWVNNDTTRCIMATGTNTVVEAEIFEVALTGDGNTTIDYTGDLSSVASSSLSFGLYDGDTVVSVSSVSYSAPTTTITFGSSIPNGQEITLITVSWHWWAEALKRTQEQCYSSFFRFNTSVEADANVAVPDDIQTGLYSDSQLYRNQSLTGLAYGNFLCDLHDSNDATGGGFTLDTTPTSDTDVAWSNLVYTDGSDSITPGTQYVTFGDISGAGTDPPTPVHFTRRFFLPFNSLTGVDNSDLDVVDARGFAYTINVSGSRNANDASNKYFYTTEGDYTISSTSGDTVYAVAFDGGYPYGIDEPFIEIVNAEEKYIGSGAVETYYAFLTAGSYIPIYNYSSFCNFASGQFPQIVGTFQDRVVVAGIPNQPLSVFMSNIGKDGSRYEYQNFEILFADQTLATSPIQLTLEGREDDRIVALRSWYDSLFVFTKRTVRRISGGQNIGVTPVNVQQQVVSEVGCRSKHGVINTDDSLLFISDSGLYQIQTTDTSGGYDAVNIGVKVERQFFENSENKPEVSWMYYNQKRDLVFIALTTTEDSFLCTRLLTFYNRRQAFSEYILYNGYFTSAYGASNVDRDFVVVPLRDTAVSAAPTTSSICCVCELNIDNLNMDLTYSPTNTQIAAGSTSYQFRTRVEHTIDNGQRIVSTLPSTLSGTASREGFKMLPLTNHYDYLNVVYDNGTFDTTMMAGTDYLRYPLQHAIYSNYLPWTTSHTFEIDLFDDEGVYPIRVIKDTVELVSGTDFTVGTSSSRLTVTYGDGNSNNVYLVGASIPAWHFTPTLLNETPLAMKRGVHYLGYYDNRNMHDFLTASDVNSADSQETIAVADRWKTTAQCSLGILYNDSRTGVYQLEVYEEDELIWDVSLFDFPSIGYRNQLYDVVRLVHPIIGVGYSVQVVNFNFSRERFALIGYQVKLRPKKRNTTRWY